MSHDTRGSYLESVTVISPILWTVFRRSLECDVSRFVPVTRDFPRGGPPVYNTIPASKQFKVFGLPGRNLTRSISRGADDGNKASRTDSIKTRNIRRRRIKKILTLTSLLEGTNHRQGDKGTYKASRKISLTTNRYMRSLTTRGANYNTRKRYS